MRCEIAIIFTPLKFSFPHDQFSTDDFHNKIGRI